MSLFSSFFAELLSVLLRNAVGAKLAGKQMSFLQVCVSPGFTIVGNQSNFSIVLNAKTCKLVLNKTSMVRVGHF